MTNYYLSFVTTWRVRIKESSILNYQSHDLNQSVENAGGAFVKGGGGGAMKEMSSLNLINKQ